MSESHTGVREISIEEFDEMIENHDDLLILDIRSAAEFELGHIPGALLVPGGILEDAAVNRLLGVLHKTLVICSQDGSRSAVPVNKFEQMGFEKIYSLTGGIKRWETQGYALVRE
jgi:rhodanese-related sulfurtransferase